MKLLALYIESGTFQASEEEVYMAGIKPGEEVVILKKADYDKLAEDAWKYNDLIE